MDRIFQPFFTTKPQRTGLGLAITPQIVQDYGGDIKVESTPGTGTRIEYSATEIGKSLSPVLDAMHKLGSRYKTVNGVKMKGKKTAGEARSVKDATA